MVKRVISSIWFLALVVAIPAVLTVIPKIEKYQIELVSKDNKATTNGISYFVDLDNNGITERVEGFDNGHNILSFQCFNNENRLIDQYNFPYSLKQSCTRLFFADVNENNLTEVYGFTISSDSVFLNWIEPLDTVELHFHSEFITTIRTNKRKDLDISILEMLFFDLDGDNKKEAVFTINVGYNLFPRQIFVFNPDVQTVVKSENFGSNFINLFAHDVNSDGKLELLCSGTSAKNIPDSIDVQFKDDRPRQFVFDENLKLLYKPIEFPKGLASYIRTLPPLEKNENITFLYQNYSFENTQSFITRIKYPESIFSGRIMLNAGKQKAAWIVPEKNSESLVFYNRGKIFRINSNFQLVDSVDLKYTSDHTFQGAFDIDKNEQNDYFISSNSENILYVYFNRFKNPEEINFEEQLYSVRNVNFLGDDRIMVSTTKNLYFYNLKTNPYYFFKYAGHILIYLFSVLFVWLVQTIRLRQLQEKYELQNRVHDLQLKTLKNQLDPHFIYNTFNTIASVIKQGRNDEAYDLFVKLSRMIRMNLDNSNEIYSTLKYEFNFVKDYLSIQKFRFKDAFDYKIEIDKNVDMQIQIPKMLILIHVENALKHGLRLSKNHGILNLRVRNNDKFIGIEIEDNGIGRKHSAKLKTRGTGIGLKTIEQIVTLNNQKSNNKISQEILDLFDNDGNSLGTKIVLRIDII